MVRGTCLWLLCALAACKPSGPLPDAGDPDAGEADAGEVADAGPTHVSVRILAINDFHGNLEYDATSPSTGPGVARLAAAIAARRTPNTVFISAGDLFGGSPLTSGLFHDEPTIEVMNAMGLDYNALGNHEFDEGAAELLRMQNGGCHPVDGCFDGGTFSGANFQHLAANTFLPDGGYLFPPYEIRDVGGAKIAFVGMTLERTPSVANVELIRELSFTDEVATMNALVPKIRAEGAQLIVLVIHEGGVFGPILQCSGMLGAIPAIAQGLDPAVLWVASGHTHQLYNCTLNGHLVTSAGDYGRALTQVDLEVELATQVVTSMSATNVPVAPTDPEDPAIAATVQKWVSRAAPLGDRVVGTITADISDTPNPTVDTQMGNVVADAMLAATAADGAQAALMVAGGIRAPLSYAASGPETVPGQVRYREAFAVQPFSNTVSSVTVTGADIVAALDTWASRPNPSALLVSGIQYTRHLSAAPGSRVTAADVTIQGVPLVPGQSYRITVNSIVAAPETTPSMANATNTVGYGIDLDILIRYLTASSPLSPPATGRIVTQ